MSDKGLIPPSPSDPESDPLVGISEEMLAVDRTMRAIMMLASNVMDELRKLGWRKMIDLEIGHDPLPCWITLRKRRVFEIRIVRHDDGRVELTGEWLENVVAPSAIEKLMGR